jgi:hypothetical protein
LIGGDLMGKKRYIIIAGIAIILIATLLLKGFVQSGDAKAIANKESDLKAQYNELKSSGKPGMIVFTYDADC